MKNRNTPETLKKDERYGRRKILDLKRNYEDSTDKSPLRLQFPQEPSKTHNRFYGREGEVSSGYYDLGRSDCYRKKWEV